MEKSESSHGEKNIEFLSIGHCCHDQYEGGHILGGTCSYASIVASQLGLCASILTSVGPDFLFHNTFKQHGVDLHIIPSDQTTVFENIYNQGSRTQYLLSRASKIKSADISDALSNSKIVLLGSIADELDFSMTERFADSMICATIQGSMRQWDDSGLVTAKAMNWSSLEGVDIAILSVDDIKGLDDAIECMRQYVSHIVVTEGENEVTVYKNGKEYTYPAYPVKEVEATGAGDVFATAYMIEYARSQDVSSACIYAHCASSFIVEGVGLQSLPTQQTIEERMSAYRDMFFDVLR